MYIYIYTQRENIFQKYRTRIIIIDLILTRFRFNNANIQWFHADIIQV